MVQFSTSSAATVPASTLGPCHTTYMPQPDAVAIAGQKITDNAISSLLCESAVIAVLVIIVAYLLAQALYRMERGIWGDFWKTVEHNLSTLFFITWTFGFCIYSVGMFITDGQTVLWSWDSVGRLIRVAPMAIIHAFEMFILESDIGAVHEEFHGNLFFMTLFSLSHFLAALTSLLFVIKHFGYNVVARVQLWLAAHSRTRTERLYMFWGLNEPSYHLAKDIRETARRGKISNSFRMLFVKTTNEEDDTGNPTGVDRLLDFLSLKNKELDKLKDLQCLSTNTYYQLSECEFTEEQKQHGVSILKGILGLRHITSLIGKTSAELHIFMLGEDEDSNVKATSNICCDSDIKTFAHNGKKVYIYCHARYDSINRVVEDVQSGGNIEVRIVDSSHDSINELKSNKEYHPVKFVDIDTADNAGSVTSGFTGLIVGFGETGQDAARFLYEFGAFVDAASPKDDDIPGGGTAGGGVQRSPFKCHIVDNNISNLKGRFTASFPALQQAGRPSPFGFNGCDIHSEQYYELLDSIAGRLNYVVVALKDDELSITAAVSIFNHVRRLRKELSKFKIFVRCHSTMYEQHMRTIAGHYNQTGAGGATKDNEHIVVFGTLKKLYTYHQIIENDYVTEGKVYNEAYCQASGNKGKKDMWLPRHAHFLAQKTLDGYSELRRKEAQDIANAYHALTKTAIMEEVCARNPAATARLRQCLQGDSGAVPLFGRPSPRGHKVSGTIRAGGNYSATEQLLFRNIARMEHLRWNAAHEILGYLHYSATAATYRLTNEHDRHRCCERLRLHNCMLNWEELDGESDKAWWQNETLPGGREYPDYKLYDFIVITTTLRLHSAKQEKQQRTT